MDTRFIASISDIDPDSWQRLWDSAYPFTRHAFFTALEASGSTSERTGWQPCHLLVEDQGQLVAAMPLFEKTHSYGEYVFDWGWADAYRRAGLEYYPKLVNAIPFTPATGPRLGFASTLDHQGRADAVTAMMAAVHSRLADTRGSGFHALFPRSGERQWFAGQHCVERQGCQFHWFNQGYGNFDDFLASFSSRKRKNIRRERQKVAEHNLAIQFRSARDTSDSDWQQFSGLYKRTYLKRSGHTGYLNADFFQLVARAMPDQVLLASAHQDSIDSPMLAGALYFRDNTTLYGRYWGTRLDVDGLHFETCYYQGIEYAIAEGLQRFDPGAQGEHKIQRGFVPVKTCSYHWLVHPQFFTAVKNFVVEEREHNDAYCADGRTYLPFREGVEVCPSDVLLSD